MGERRGRGAGGAFRKIKSCRLSPGASLYSRPAPQHTINTPLEKRSSMKGLFPPPPPKKARPNPPSAELGWEEGVVQLWVQLQLSYKEKEKGKKGKKDKISSGTKPARGTGVGSALTPVLSPPPQPRVTYVLREGKRERGGSREVKIRLRTKPAPARSQRDWGARGSPRGTARVWGAPSRSSDVTRLKRSQRRGGARRPWGGQGARPRGPGGARGEARGRVWSPRNRNPGDRQRWARAEGGQES